MSSCFLSFLQYIFCGRLVYAARAVYGAKKIVWLWGERKAQKALDAANECYEAHCPQIKLYESAEQYLRDVLQGSFDPKKLPPVTKWKEERARLIADKQSLTRDYYALKNEVAEAEKIQRNVYDIVSAERRREQPRRARDMEWYMFKAAGLV